MSTSGSPATGTGSRGGGERRRVPGRVLLGAFLLALLAAMAISTEYVSASAPVPGKKAEFDPAAFGQKNYASKVKPAIEKNPVDLATLAPLIKSDPEAAGEKYGKRAGSSPYAYSVKLAGTAGEPVGGLLPVTVPDLPKEFRVSVQVGPAINGTILRDVTGTINFNDFVNQVDFANAATALNTEMKADLLDGLDPKSLAGKKVTVVGAIAPLSPEVITVTPVSIETGQ